jgi:hypothetical protein
MSILDAVIRGAKAIMCKIAPTLKETVRMLVEEIDRSVLGRVLTQTLKNINQRYFAEARSLAEEERELAEKLKRDGRFREADLDRIKEIRWDRKELRQKLSELKTAEAQDELKAASGELINTPLTLDEFSAAIGLMTSKECPSCGGVMRLVQYPMKENGKRSDTHPIKWKCIQIRHTPCRILAVNLEDDAVKMLRRPDPDLDGSVKERRSVWERPDVLAKTHLRLRQGLGEYDEEVICPVHAMPMRFLPIPRADGTLLSSYHFVCLGVNLNGSACSHSVPVQSFPQVSSALRRHGDGGIIDG